MKDKVPAAERASARSRRGGEALGPTGDIGTRLRALYGAVEDEPIPEKLLDLLEKLDQAEAQGDHDPSRS